MKIEGTDYPSTMWQPIAVELGEAAILEEKHTHDKWDNLEYNNYLEWVKATIEIHRKYGLKKDVFEALIQSAEYNEGVEEFFNELDRREYVPVLISGGFQNLIRRAQNELDIEYGFGACEYHFDDYGYLISHSLQPSDFEGKVHFLDTLIKTLKINKMTDWVFVGDGKNDVSIAKKAPLAFGINAHDDLKAVPGLIEINTFMEIIPYLDNSLGQKENDTPPILSEQTQKAKIRKHDSDENLLKKRVILLEREVRTLKQKLNDQKGKNVSKARIEQIKVSEIDYELTPRKQLSELLKEINVVFLGLDKNSSAFNRVKAIKALKVVSGMKNNIDNRVISNADFLFIYKNCVTHSDVANAFSRGVSPPCCYLLEHTNNDLLENAMANVLYRYIYK